MQAFQSATRNAVGCLKRTDGGPSSSSCNTSDSHHPGGQNQQHPLQQRYHNGGGVPSTPGMPGSAGAIGKQPPISRPTPKSNQHENNNSSLNGTLYQVLQSGQSSYIRLGFSIWNVANTFGQTVSFFIDLNSSAPIPVSREGDVSLIHYISGGLVLSSLMNSDGHHGSHSGHHHSGSSGSSGSAAAAAAAALVQGIATTSGGSNMSNRCDS